MKKNRLAAGLLALILALSLCMPVFAQEEFLTKAQAADLIIIAADDYNPSIQRKELVSLNPSDEAAPVTRVEAYAMMALAFGTLPEAGGNDLRLQNIVEPFSDIPQWALEPIESLRLAGLLDSSEPSLFGANEPVTLKELQNTLSQFFRLFGTNKKDDFYTAVNKQWLDASVLPAGKSTVGTSTELNQQISDELEGILEELIAVPHERGTSEQRIADFFKSALDWESRNAQGYAPLKPYFDQIDTAQTINDLVAVDCAMAMETGASYLFTFTAIISIADSTAREFQLTTFQNILSRAEYVKPTHRTKAHKQLMTDLQVLIGIDEETAAANTAMVYEAQKTVGQQKLLPNELSDMSLANQLITLKELDDMFPEVDILAAARQSGLKVDEEATIRLRDPVSVNAASAFYTQDHLELLKSIMRTTILVDNMRYLDQRFMDAGDTYTMNYNGVANPVEPRRRAIDLTLSAMAKDLSQVFVKLHGTQALKDDVGEMIDQFIMVYSRQLEGADWLSPATREKALLKLEKLTVKIGWPDQFDTLLTDDAIKTYEDGGSLLQNIMAVHSAAYRDDIEHQNDPVDKSLWQMNAFTTNAYYEPANNEIVFPLGILLAPYYDINQSHSRNVGSIGAIIAHEISHAFDSHGALYDEVGTYVNWWTDEDYQAFTQKCAAVIAFFDGSEIAPGIYSSGELTQGEDIADLSGLICALEVAQLSEDFSAEEFFEAYAFLWHRTHTYSSTQNYAATDVHSLNILRVNKVLQNIPLFQETYHLVSGDGMYLAPENQIKIW